MTLPPCYRHGGFSCPAAIRPAGWRYLPRRNLFSAHPTPLTRGPIRGASFPAGPLPACRRTRAGVSGQTRRYITFYVIDCKTSVYDSMQIHCLAASRLAPFASMSAQKSGLAGWRVALFRGSLTSLPGIGGQPTASHETSSRRLPCPYGHKKTAPEGG